MAANDELYWRETYFILFPHKRRPTLKQVSAALVNANCRFQIENPASDPEGLLESLLVESPEDHAAVEISYEVGDAIIEQNLAWAKELREDLAPAQLQELIIADARIDVAHFERMTASNGSANDATFPDEFADPEDDYDMLDPTCLLTVVETLAGLTGGLTFDPASGEILA